MIKFEMEKKMKPGMFLLVSFGNAYDSTNWDYINLVLGVYNSGQDSKKWLEVLSQESYRRVINKGHFSEFCLNYKEAADRETLCNPMCSC